MNGVLGPYGQINGTTALSASECGRFDSTQIRNDDFGNLI